jgi:hypothetical protein
MFLLPFSLVKRGGEGEFNVKREGGGDFNLNGRILTAKVKSRMIR